jgi:hypothetical protein
MTTTITALPPDLAQLVADADALDAELAEKLAEYERLTSGEDEIVSSLQELAKATSDPARDRVLNRLRPLITEGTLPASLATTADIRKLGTVASEALRKLVEQEQDVERQIHAIAAQRDRAAAEFAEAAHAALEADPALVESIRAVMGMAAGGEA